MLFLLSQYSRMLLTIIFLLKITRYNTVQIIFLNVFTLFN